MLITGIVAGVVVLVAVLVWVVTKLPPDDPYFLERGEMSPKYDRTGVGATYDKAQQERALKKQRRQEITMGRVRRRHTDAPVATPASATKVVPIRRAGKV